MLYLIYLIIIIDLNYIILAEHVKKKKKNI